jgi:hypothetical protein
MYPDSGMLCSLYFLSRFVGEAWKSTPGSPNVDIYIGDRQNHSYLSSAVSIVEHQIGHSNKGEPPVVNFCGAKFHKLSIATNEGTSDTLTLAFLSNLSVSSPPNHRDIYQTNRVIDRMAQECNNLRYGVPLISQSKLCMSLDLQDTIMGLGLSDNTGLDIMLPIHTGGGSRNLLLTNCRPTTVGINFGKALGRLNWYDARVRTARIDNKRCHDCELLYQWCRIESRYLLLRPVERFAQTVKR